VLHLDKGSVDGVLVIVGKNIILLMYLIFALFETFKEAIEDRQNLSQGTSVSTRCLTLRDHSECVKWLQQLLEMA